MAFFVGLCEIYPRVDDVEVGPVTSRELAERLGVA